MSAGRAASLALIALLHVLLLGALVALGGPRAIAHRVASLEVRFVAPAPRPLPSTPPVPLPMKSVRAPEIALPTLPPIEIAIAPPTEAPAISVAATAPPTAAAAHIAPRPMATEGPSVQPPRFDLAYLRNPAPAYPPASRRLKEEGRVVLRVRVGPAGQVEAIELAASSGHVRLDQAALAAVREWRFTPARAGERPVTGVAMVPVVFELNG